MSERGKDPRSRALIPLDRLLMYAAPIIVGIWIAAWFIAPRIKHLLPGLIDR